MKKIVLMSLLFLTLFYSKALARYIDVKIPVVKDDSLMYNDLQEIALDRYGRKQYDEKKRLLYKYNPCLNEILKASQIKLMEGYGDGTFRPNESITRAEFIKIAIAMSTSINFNYSTIPTTVKHWVAPYLAVGEMQKVFAKGKYNDKNLDEPITRIEMICILSNIQIKMKGISQYRDAELPAYVDIEKLTKEEKELLLHAAKYELISGMFDTKELKPYDSLTRAEAARAIMRVY